MTRPRYFLLLCLLLAVSAASQVYAQGHTVRGTVLSTEDRDALPGANVVVKGTTIGTSTDADGGFTLTAPSPNDTLQISFVGYETLEVAIGGQTTIVVALAPQMTLTGELVVVGYGAQRRRDVTGSVSSVTSRDIQELPVTDAGQALQGRAGGLVALSEGGRPGESVTIRVRGRRSLTASNDPLYVVDGIPLEGGINTINPRDIESMEVLKDASATAIYGSRGANGVILITTNRGGDHGTRVSYSAHTGVSQVIGRPDMMSGAEFAEMKRESRRAAGLPDDDATVFNAIERDALARGISTDYQDLLFERGYQQSHQFSIAGGDARTRFMLSGNFFDEKGTIETQAFRRFAFRLNLDHHVSDWFRIGTSSQISDVTQNWASNPFGSAMATSPLTEPYDANGNLIFQPGADPLVFNPLADLEENAYLDDRSTLRVFGNLFAEVDLLKNLQYRVNFGPDLQSWERGEFQASRTAARQGGTPFARKRNARIFTYTFENILNYNTTLGRDHTLALTGLYSVQESRADSTDVRASGLPYETQLYHNLGTGTTVEGYGSRLSDWGLQSFMGRLNYQFKGRYLLTLTGRLDGSSRLAAGNRWGVFPSIGLGWRISDEPFMGGQGIFSELKLRASYGRTGNTAISPYMTQGRLAREAYAFDNVPAYGYRPQLIPNPDLEWEVSSQADVGLDFGLWNDRVVGTVDVYQTRTTGLLLERQLPPSSGYSFVLENIGETMNRGYEVSLSTRNVSTSDFSWTTDFSVFGNREEIVDLYGDKEDDPGNRWFVGEPTTVWYDYEKVGIWQVGEEAEAARYNQQVGQIRVRDVNDDGRINEQDRMIRGSDMPTMTGGITNRFRYKSLDFSFFLFGSFGHTVYNAFLVDNSTLQGRYNNLDVDYWTPSSPTNDAPRPDSRLERPQYGSTRGYVKGDFLKVRNVQLGYTLPARFTRRQGIRYMRLYVNADTPFVFSHLGALDPEVYSTRDDNNDGFVDGGTLQDDIVPSTTLYTIGVSIDF